MQDHRCRWGIVRKEKTQVHLQLWQGQVGIHNLEQSTGRSSPDGKLLRGDSWSLGNSCSTGLTGFLLKAGQALDKD